MRLRYRKNVKYEVRSSKISCESGIGQHILTNPEYSKIYKDDNFPNIGLARSSFHVNVVESVYIKNQN